MAEVAVLGMGNILLKDEGIGVHVAWALESVPLPHGVKVIDGGTLLDVMPFVEGASKLIVIDAASWGGEPGSIYRLTFDEIAIKPEPIFSLHQVGLVENLSMVRALGGPKEIVIIAVEPKEIAWGLELSPELERKVPQIMELVQEEINALLGTEAL